MMPSRETISALRESNSKQHLSAIIAKSCIGWVY